MAVTHFLAQEQKRYWTFSPLMKKDMWGMFVTMELTAIKQLIVGFLNSKMNWIVKGNVEKYQTMVLPENTVINKL